MESKRCFIGIPTPSYVKLYHQVVDLDNGLDVKYKPVKPELYHFTLHFFGEIDKDDIERITTSFEEFHIDPFILQLGEPNIIPNRNPRKTRVLYLSPIQGTFELQQLAKTVSSIIREARFEVKRKQYLPHLTVARVKYGKDRQKLAERWLNKEVSLPKLTVDKIVLFESTLSPSGPQYDQIYAFGN